nr:integrase, catalytic region, zinc finger, CCHC-type, peptidase aspartic, catalytic [Tanacetum cinerariifolium]
FGDLQWGNILITKVYFVEGFGHNLFSAGQFYDSNLEVAFRRNACFVRNLEGVDLLKGDQITSSSYGFVWTNENCQYKWKALFKKVSEQKDNTQDTSENTKFAKKPIEEIFSKVGKTNALSKPITLNSVSTPQEPKSMNNAKVIALGMFRINPSKTSKEEKHMPNTVSASARTKPITVSQPAVFTRKDVNSNLNGLSSTGVDNTKTKRP